MRRLILIAVASAILFSACSSAAATAPPTPAASPTPAPTPVPTQAPSPTLAPADAGWVAVTPPGDGFQAMFPGTPKPTTSTTSTKAGPTPTTVWEFLANSNLDYNVALWQYPAGTAAGTTAAAMYDGAISGMDSANQLTLQTQSDITLSGRVGRAFTLSGSSYVLQGELVLAGDNLYMVYASYGPTVDTTVVTAFLADFQLTA